MFNQNKIFSSTLFITSVILINFLFSYININFDLTSDQNHSVSIETQEIIKELDDKIFIKVYLEGEFPSEFKHLQLSTYNFLKLLKELSPNLIDFQFIDPNSIVSDQERLALFQQLVSQGLAPTDLEIRKLDSKTNQIIFPGALIYYKDKYIAVNFLKNKISERPGDNINSSIEISKCLEIAINEHGNYYLQTS